MSSWTPHNARGYCAESYLASDIPIAVLTARSCRQASPVQKQQKQCKSGKGSETYLRYMMDWVKVVKCKMMIWCGVEAWVSSLCPSSSYVVVACCICPVFKRIRSTTVSESRKELHHRRRKREMKEACPCSHRSVSPRLTPGWLSYWTGLPSSNQKWPASKWSHRWYPADDGCRAMCDGTCIDRLGNPLPYSFLLDATALADFARCGWKKSGKDSRSGPDELPWLIALSVLTGSPPSACPIYTLVHSGNVPICRTTSSAELSLAEELFPGTQSTFDMEATSHNDPFLASTTQS